VTRDRVTTWVIVAAAVGLGTWIALHTYWTQSTVWTPLRGEAVTNPYYSVERLVQALGVRTQRLSSLRTLPSTSDVLLITSLQGDIARTRFELLQHWVEGGGRLAVSTNVVWSTPAFQNWSGIAPAHQDPVKSNKEAPPAAGRTVLVNKLDWEDRCSSFAVQIDGHSTGESLQLCTLPTIFGFVSKHVPEWALSNEQGLQMLRVKLGRGSVTVSETQYQLNPRVFLHADNAQAFIDGVQLKRGDRLIIFTPSAAEPLLSMLWRLAAPAILCFGLAALLLIWRHLPPFGPKIPVPAAARRSLAEQLRANARFAWRTGNLKPLRAAVLRALDRDAGARIPGYAAFSVRQRAVALGSRAGIDPAALNAAMTEAASGSPAVQSAAITLLEQARRALFTSSSTQGVLHDR